MVCCSWMNRERMEEGAARAGLDVLTVLPVFGKKGKRVPLFMVYTMSKRGSGPSLWLLPLVVRDENNRWTPGYRAVLECMGIPTNRPKRTSSEL